MRPEDSFTNYANRSSTKWLRYDADVLPMHVAEMDFEVAKPIRDKISEMALNSDLGYLGIFPGIGPAFASFAKRRWGWEVDPTGIKLATDVGVAAVEILKTVTSPGDRVLINSPVYAAFFAWIKEAGCVPHDAPLELDGETWKLDLAAIRAAFEQGVKVFLLCSPQNPIGRIHTAQELTEIAMLAKEFDVLVISDEIHAPLSWGPFTPYLSLGSQATETGVTITSSSKAWNTAGLKAGFLVTQSDAVRSKLAGLPEAMQWRSSILGAHAMVSAYTESVDWLDETVATLQENLEHLRHEVSTMLPKAKMFELEATYLAWIDLEAYGIPDLANTILKEAKVSVNAGPDHSPGDDFQGFIRFNFATSKPRITEAVRRISELCEGPQ
ncbi:MAG: aminotransferase class I/II-fold pyridoxal phosphate-dependent enzyme [Aquiluna sp.]|nr:aminotransferase class I/II-fold pyridoxal phosphate-dependent enzyme [Aquiluna sp.]